MCKAYVLKNTVEDTTPSYTELQGFYFPGWGKGEPLMFGWKAERRNQFCSDVTWQLATETGMTFQGSHFLVTFKP